MQKLCILLQNLGQLDSQKLKVEITAEKYTQNYVFPFVICEFKYAKNWLNQQMED